jgi:hypothetical protein
MSIINFSAFENGKWIHSNEYMQDMLALKLNEKKILRSHRSRIVHQKRTIDPDSLNYFNSPSNDKSRNMNKN